MSSVAVPVYHYALLKGYLAGQSAPAEVLAAVEALYAAAIQGPLRDDALEAIRAVREAAERLAGMPVATPAVEMTIAKPELSTVVSETEEIELPPLTRRALEKAVERTDAAATPSAPQTDEAKIAAFLEAREAEQFLPAHAAGGDHEVVVGHGEPKKRKEWSPEARAAAADRMRARQAAGLMKGRKKAESESYDREADEPEPSSYGEEDLRITVPIKTRKTRLTDDDWSEIKARVAKGHSREAIAGDYDEEVEDLETFITSHQRREAKQPPGEVRAPL